jgi:hypothetical protein
MKFETKYFGTLCNEFSRAEFGDERLTGRLMQIGHIAAQKPERSFPKMFETSAELEGAYRFLRHYCA